MKKLQYNWLDTGWSQLQAMRSRLPHALLMSGPAGIGKRLLAEYFAQSLLCEKLVPSGEPCGECGACRWFADGNHPDYRAVLPEILQPESSQVADAMADASSEAGGAKSKAAPSKVIKIGQIRALDGFFNVGTHRAGHRVVVVYPADVLNVDAGSALLKTLEEPPADTLFLLVTSRISEVLPTIRSRCAKLPLSRPAPARTLAWLASEGVRDPESALAEAGGAPLAAAIADPHADFRETLLAALAGERAIDPIALAEKCEKAGATNICVWLARWTSDLVLCESGLNVRYHPKHGRALKAAAGRMRRADLYAYYRRLMRMRRVSEHPLNTRLFAEELLIDYARLAAPGN